MLGLSQANILAALLESARLLPDRPIERVVLGECLAGVMAGRTGPADAAWRTGPGGPPWNDPTVGLASRIARPRPEGSGGQVVPGAIARPDDGSGAATGRRPYSYEGPSPHGGGAKAMARLLLFGDPDEATLGMAALNALLPPPTDGLEMKGQELLLQLGRGRDVCVVGHFPFVERLSGEFSNLWVVEKFPRPGDYPEERTAEFMARADIAVVTGTTLLNGTLANLLTDWRGRGKEGPRNAFILMGPSCPFSPALFDMGVDVLAGSRVVDPEAVLSGLAGGACFRGLDGVRTTLWPRPGFFDDWNH